MAAWIGGWFFGLCTFLMQFCVSSPRVADMMFDVESEFIDVKWVHIIFLNLFGFKSAKSYKKEFTSDRQWTVKKNNKNNST